MPKPSLAKRIRAVAAERGYEIKEYLRDGSFTVWTPYGGIGFNREGSIDIVRDESRAEARSLVEAARRKEKI